MAGARKGKPRDPYAIIRSYWGEDLSTALLSRIVGSPAAHLDDFESHIIGNVGWVGRALPKLPSGHLRPVISVNAVDYVMAKEENEAAPTLAAANNALVVLLYAHEVVIDDISPLLAHQDSATRMRAGEWLISVKPLFDRGLLHFAPVTSIKRHPSNATIVGPFLESARRLLREQNEDIEALVQASFSDDDSFTEDDLEETRQLAISALLLDATSYNRYSLTWPDQIHRLLRSRAEEAVFKFILGQVNPGPQHQSSIGLRKLLELAVPNFLPSAKALVAMRQNDEHFADWRQQLGLALDRVLVNNPADADQMREARYVMHGELEPLRRRVEKASGKSSALSALRTGAAGFGVSAVGASAAWLVGGSMPAAITSAVVTKGIDSFASYIKNKQELRLNSAILDLTLMFDAQAV